MTALRLRVAELEAALAARDADVARLKADLDAFKIRYRRDVGLLHEQLDELDRAIAEAEAGGRGQRVDAAAPRDTPRSGARPDAAPRFTSDAIRKLFRDVAKAVHPDLARDALARDRRHSLMIEANQAYALGDEDRLRWVLEAWARSPEAVTGTDPESARLRLVRRIAQIEEQLDACADDLAAVQETPLWKLKVMVDEAAARGHDLVADMVRRLRRDVMVAQNRLDAMTAPASDRAQRRVLDPRA